MWKRRCFLVSLLTMILMIITIVPLCAQAENVFSFAPKREYNGVMYEARPSAELTNVLLIGYDHYANGAIKELHGYSNGGQSDFLLLLSIDHENKVVRTLQFDRDTMTTMYVTDVNGKQHRMNNLQLCLAHAYGNTREKNNANTVQAVETLLSISAPDDGVQIDWYMAMDISGISKLNDLIGGVTVTLEDDMSMFDPEMTKGATIHLTGMQSELYVRGRSKIGDGTNASRMRRQRDYMYKAKDILLQKIMEDVNFGNEILNEMGIVYDRTTVEYDNPFSFADPVAGTPSGEQQGLYLTTNESQSEIVGLLARIKDYEFMSIDTLPGTHAIGEKGYMEFRVEKDAGLKWSLNVFYKSK